MAEKTLKQQLNDLLREASANATFSKETMQHFLSLQESVDSLERQLKFVRDERDQHKKDLMAAEKILDDIGDRKASLDKWEEELQGREREVQRLELTAQYEEKRREDVMRVVESVFRNTEVRRQMVTPGYPGYVDSNGINQYGEPSSTHDTTEKAT